MRRRKQRRFGPEPTIDTEIDWVIKLFQRYRDRENVALSDP